MYRTVKFIEKKKYTTNSNQHSLIIKFNKRNMFSRWEKLNSYPKPVRAMSGCFSALPLPITVLPIICEKSAEIDA